MRKLYAIIDTQAAEILGTIFIQRADAAAIRMFGDIATHRDSIVAKHTVDFQLATLGSIDDNHVITPGFAVVLTGSQWQAAQQPAVAPDMPSP